jgi:hypothetical protein
MTVWSADGSVVEWGTRIITYGEHKGKMALAYLIRFEGHKKL